MTFKIGSKVATTADGIPFLWNTGDVSTASNSQLRISNPNPTTDDNFGISVDISYNRYIVGAYRQDNGANSSVNQGAAYVYDHSGTLLNTLTASDQSNNDYFGIRVAIGANTIAVGAYGDDYNGNESGSVYIFNLSGTQITKIYPSDPAAYDYFGYNVKIYNGNIYSVSYGKSTYAGAFYIHNRSGTQLKKVTAPDGASNDYFGTGFDVGNGLVVAGAYGDDDNGSSSGSVYVFDYAGNYIKKIKPSDGAASAYFGVSVAVGCGRIVVGAWGDSDKGTNAGAVYIFDLNGTQLRKIYSPGFHIGDKFGSKVGVGSGRIGVSCYRHANVAFDYVGKIYLYDLDGNYVDTAQQSDPYAGSFEFDFGAGGIVIKDGKIIIGHPTAETAEGLGVGSVYTWTVPNVTNIYDALDKRYKW